MRAAKASIFGERRHSSCEFVSRYILYFHVLPTGNIILHFCVPPSPGFLSATKIKKTGAVVKKILVGVFAVGTALTSGVAFAGQMDDVLTRLDAIEKENSAIRKENTALLENKRLREQNAKLKSSIPEPRSAEPRNAEPQYSPTPVIAAAPAPTRSAPLGLISQAIEDVRSDLFGAAKSDPFGAYAADLPVQYKAHVESPGQLRLWGEGGAIWTGGDPVTQAFNLTNFTSLFALGPRTVIPGSFDLTPKIGWEGATGFDYRFPDSLWHVSAQFRYGEGGKTSGLASSSGVVDPLFIAALAAGGGGGFFGLPGAVLTGAGGSESFGASYKETHWLADLAVGRDVLGSGANALQVKGGLRVSEFVAKTTTTDNSNFFFNFTPTPIFPGGPLVSSVSSNTSTVVDQRQAFLGAGPLIGIEGAVPFAGKWSLDYTGDAAVLFGTQKFASTTTTNVTTTPAFFGGFFGGASGVNTLSNERFGTVFSADIQVGISYWITENIKLGASYRLDAMINVQNQDTSPVTNLTPDRYTHGPRVKLTGQF
jgi:Legionella pneumophila major outer membrane protein precursor